MEWLIVLATAAAVLLLAVYALTGVHERAEARAVARPHRRVPGRGRARLGARTPLLDRAVDPMKERLTETARKYTPGRLRREGPRTS